MKFSSRLPLAELIEFCRTLRFTLGAGLSLAQVFRQQAAKGPGSVRAVAGEMAAALERGDSLETALDRHQDFFPPLFLALVGVGERTGNLPEIFAELERYFDLQLRLRRRFAAQAAKPVLQFIAAVGIITFLIWVLGAIAAAHGTTPIDITGLGLTGTGGAIGFLVLVMSVLGLAAGFSLFARRAGRHGATANVYLLRLPIVGPCLRAVAMTRFCLALRLTMESGMPIADAAGLSLRATGNPAFLERVPLVRSALRKGRDLTESLGPTGLFLEEFLHILTVAETSGQEPEVMRQQGRMYAEEAERRLATVTQLVAGLVWFLVAAFIIVAIFRIFVTVYLGPLNALTG